MVQRQVEEESSNQAVAAPGEHIPVLVEECLDLLAPAFQVDHPVMVDATCGLGGHTKAALCRFSGLTVIGIDRDQSALDRANKRLEAFGSRFIPYHGTYDQIGEALAGKQADGILMDLGVSSMQLDEVQRGFSYAHDAPLDMRMDQSRGRTAAELLNEVEESELARMLRQYSDERFARPIAREIVTRRRSAPFHTTSQLVEAVRASIPAPARRTGGNPAKRTFQAVRIAVNDELTILAEALPAALESLRIGGRIVVESYQSLEDRLVKRIFRDGAAEVVPEDLPVPEKQAEEGKRLRLLTRGAMKATAEEIQKNPRAQSVRVRAAELIIPWRPHV